MNPETRKTIEARIDALRMAAELGLTARDIAKLMNIDARQVQAWLNAKEKSN